MVANENPAEGSMFQISASAARRIAVLMAEEGVDSFLRVAVDAGGCSGYQYNFDLEKAAPGADDVTFHRDGAAVVVDKTSLELLGGSEIDYVEDLSGSYFRVHNPNAQSSCGCGMSFAMA